MLNRDKFYYIEGDRMTMKKKPEDLKKRGAKQKLINPAEAQKKLDDYYAEQKANNKPPTISGIARVLDVDRGTLLNIEKEKKDYNPEIVSIVKKAKARVLEYLEERLDSNNCTGAIFNLKCNFGFVDTQKVETNVSGGIDVNIKIVD